MKRSEALKLIANQLDFLKGRFHGLRTNFSESELKEADVILTTLEDAGMQPPLITLEQLIPTADLKPTGEPPHYYACWEPEAEEDEDPFLSRSSGAV
jgi:hypothetical protein